MRESRESHDRLSRVKKQGVRLSRAWRAGRDSRQVLDQKGAMKESWRATTGSVRVKEARRETQPSWRARKDSCRILEPKRNRGES